MKKQKRTFKKSATRRTRSAPRLRRPRANQALATAAVTIEPSQPPTKPTLLQDVFGEKLGTIIGEEIGRVVLSVSTMLRAAAEETTAELEENNARRYRNGEKVLGQGTGHKEAATTAEENAMPSHPAEMGGQPAQEPKQKRGRKKKESEAPKVDPFSAQGISSQPTGQAPAAFDPFNAAPVAATAPTAPTAPTAAPANTLGEMIGQTAPLTQEILRGKMQKVAELSGIGKVIELLNKNQATKLSDMPTTLWPGFNAALDKEIQAKAAMA